MSTRYAALPALRCFRAPRGLNAGDSRIVRTVTGPVSPELPHEPPADLAAASLDALIGPLGHGTPNPDFPVTGAVERPVTYPPRPGHRNPWARKAQGRS